MNKDGVLRLSTVLFVSLCMPASVSAHTRPVRLCIALPAGGAAFAQIGQEELTISLIMPSGPMTKVVRLLGMMPGPRRTP